MKINLGTIEIREDLVEAMKRVKNFDEYAAIEEQNANTFEVFCAFMIVKERCILDELIDAYMDNSLDIDYVSSYFDSVAG